MQKIVTLVLAVILAVTMQACTKSPVKVSGGNGCGITACTNSGHNISVEIFGHKITK